MQAEEAGRRIGKLTDGPADLEFVASPLGRTRETMEILRGALGLPATQYRRDARLAELTFGKWEGLTWREVRSRDPALAAQRERDKWNFVPPDGESYAMLLVRVAPAIAALDRPAVVVSHGGVARVLLCALAGMPEHEAPRADIWQGRVLVFSDGTFRWA